MRKFGTLILAGLLLHAASPVLLLIHAQEAQQPQQSTNAQAALTNTDILELQKSGFSTEIIVAKIKATKGQFDTSPAALQELKKGNIPDAVILAMIEASKPVTPEIIAPAAMPATEPGGINSNPANSEVKPPDVIIPEDTPVKLRIMQNASSGTAKVNDTVEFAVVEDVKVGDLVVIPQGATAIATVIEAQPKRRLGRSGKLNINIDYVRSAKGEKIPLRAVKGGKGGNHTAAMTGAIVASSILFFPAAPLFLFMKGKDITIPKGTEITAFVAADTPLGRVSQAPQE